MAKYLQDIGIWVDSHKDMLKWGTSSNFLERLYLDSLPKVETKTVSKVSIAPCRVLPEAPLELVLRNPDCFKFSVLFDFESYFAADKEKKKRRALELLHGGLVAVARIKGWDVTLFERAYKSVLAKKFVCYRPWSKPVSSPDRMHKAQVWCNFESDKAELFVLTFTGQKVVSKTLVTTLEAGEYWISNIAGVLEWDTEAIARLTSKDKLHSWAIDVVAGKAKSEFTR